MQAKKQESKIAAIQLIYPDTSLLHRLAECILRSRYSQHRKEKRVKGRCQDTQAKFAM